MSTQPEHPVPACGRHYPNPEPDPDLAPQAKARMGARILTCTLPADHLGEHGQADTPADTPEEPTDG